MSRLNAAIKQIVTARQYAGSLLEDVDGDDWFRQPSEGVTHIAWEVGHMAAAEYYLTMVRIRGPKESDAELLSEDFLGQFGRGSIPASGPEGYPDSEEIRRVFDGVHRQALEELKQLPEEVLDEATDPPHPMFSTKLGALMFCPLHEMVHAGQIGLLRRLFGKAPLR